MVRGPLQALATLALLLSAPAAYAVSRIQNHYLFEWYLLFLLPGVIAAVAVGLDGWRQRISGTRLGPWAGWLVVLAVVGCYVAYTTPQRTWLLTRPLQQIRESAERTRPTLDPFAPENEAILTASFIGPPDPYDARIKRFGSLFELGELMKLADRSGQTFFVNFGFLPTVHLRYPAMLKVLSDPELFEPPTELQGFEPINDRYVYQYRAGSLGDRKLGEGLELSPEEKMIENRYGAGEGNTDVDDQ